MQRLLLLISRPCLIDSVYHRIGSPPGSHVPAYSAVTAAFKVQRVELGLWQCSQCVTHSIFITKGNPTGSRGCHQPVPNQHPVQGELCQRHQVHLSVKLGLCLLGARLAYNRPEQCCLHFAQACGSFLVKPAGKLCLFLVCDWLQADILNRGMSGYNSRWALQVRKAGVPDGHMGRGGNKDHCSSTAVGWEVAPARWVMCGWQQQQRWQAQMLNQACWGAAADGCCSR
jgi:hypothetical protein